LTYVDHKMSRLLKVDWLDGPGLFPSDIRARRLTLSMDDRYSISHGTRTVWRIVFRCNATCRVIKAAQDSLPAISSSDPFTQNFFSHMSENRKSSIAQAAQAQDSAADSEDTEGHQSQAEGGAVKVDRLRASKHTKQKQKALCNAKVVVRRYHTPMSPPTNDQLEMTVDQCKKGVCTIIRKRANYHKPNTDRRNLNVSPYIRRLLHEASSMFGMTLGSLTACEHLRIRPPR